MVCTRTFVALGLIAMMAATAHLVAALGVMALYGHASTHSDPPVKVGSEAMEITLQTCGEACSTVNCPE